MITGRKSAIELVDISNLTEEEWHQWRTKGIGGSDCAAIMGLSPFATTRDIYYKKKGIQIALEKEEASENWVAKEVGHRLESLVADIFSVKTKLKPYAVRKIFAHPDYSFMLANVDYFVQLPDGQTAILECKTSNANAIHKWDNDGVPINYELQCRHYMAILNMDVAYIACLYGNNENEFLWRRIERDIDYELDLIEQEENFWHNYVLANIEPPYTECGDLVLKSIRNYYGYGDTKKETTLLPKDLFLSIESYLKLKEEKASFEKDIKELDNKIKKVQFKFLEALGTACSGICKKGNTEFQISYNPVYKEKINMEGLKASYPVLYQQFSSKEESYRRLNIKQKDLTM